MHKETIADSSPRLHREHRPRSKHTNCTKHPLLRRICLHQLGRHRCPGGRLPTTVQVRSRNIQFFCHSACIRVASTKSLNFACGLCCRSMRVQIRVDAILVRDVLEGRQRIVAYFHTAVYDVDDTQDLDLQQVAAHLSKHSMTLIGMAAALPSTASPNLKFV